MLPPDLGEDRWYVWVLVILFVLFFMVTGYITITTVQARGLSDEAQDTRKCSATRCGDLMPWVLVVTGFGEDVGFLMRSENGCYLAGYVTLREGAERAACYESYESALLDYPTLSIVGEGYGLLND